MAYIRLVLWFVIFPLLAQGQSFFTYIGQIESRSVLIAWGYTGRLGNTIGRTSASAGPAKLTIANRTLETEQNFLVVNDLQPDTSYTYQLAVRDRKMGEGTVRTYPEHTAKLCFLVIGDYGTGTAAQYRVGEVMAKEIQRRAASDNPVRFVLTLGDNIYADFNFGVVAARSGSEDAHWESKFYRPYQDVIRQVPFYPTLGNHDGNGTENRGDLFVYLDNFFFPHNKPARWYTFTFADLAQFFALDSTDSSEEGRPAPVYLSKGTESGWLREVLPPSKLPWKIPYFHHPIYNAGPRHGSSLNDLKHWVDLFQQNGVKVVFNGHEHNFQFTEQGAATGNIEYVVSGAGGELRPGDVKRKMAGQHIQGWAPQRHFLEVEIQGRAMTIAPLSYEEIRVRDRDGKAVRMPIAVNLP